MEVAQRYQDSLARIKNNVEQSYEYFLENFSRYTFFRKFVFQTSLSQDDISLLKFQNKPQLEFNILPAYIARLRGEFSKQEPSIEVMAGDEEPIDPNTINVVQGHVKHILCQANKDGCEYNVYTDTLSGGFSVLKVWTEYAHEKSFNQVIRMGRVFDPTLCGFDPMAQLPHKGDGQYCFELYPKTKDEFAQEYPDISLSDFKFIKNVGAFSWSYRGEKEDVVVICDYYEKKRKKIRILKLSDGQTMTKDDYEEYVQKWNESGNVAQAPQVVNERKTEITTICRYRLIENRIIEYIETDFKYLPLVFVDGDSVIIRDGVQGAVRQICRPYVFHAKDTQRLKNYAGQCLANELENMVQHKWMTAQESLPQQEDYLAAWDNPQIASVLVYKAFNDSYPDQALPPPREIVRPQIPAEITNTFMISDQLTQGILGSYDAQLGIQQNQLSGVAIQEGATQSNAAAMPYIVGFLQALNRVAEIIIDLIPKYYKTPRTMPIVNPRGQKDYVMINAQHPQSVNVVYEENALSVKVEAGVNFSIQKSRALQEIISLMQASPLFAQFMNTEGLEVLLDNIEIRGIDQLKSMTSQWMQQQKMMQQQQMQQSSQMPNPQVMQAQTNMAKVQQQSMKDKMQYDIDQKKLQHELLKLQAGLEESRTDAALQERKAQTELSVHNMDHNIEVTDMRHRHVHDFARFAHDVQQASKLQSPSQEKTE